MPLTFENLLLISAVAFFLCMLLLAYRTGGFRNSVHLIEQASSYNKFSVQKVVSAIHYLLLLTFVTLSGVATIVGSRTWVIYVLEGALFVSLIVQVRLQGRKAWGLTLFTLSIIGIVASIVPLLENSLLVFGPDQPRDIVAANSIVTSGNLTYASASSGGYYSFVPSLASLAAVLGMGAYLSVPVIYVILTATVALLLTVSMFLAADRLLNSQTAGVVCVMFLLSIPRLSSVDLIPELFSLALSSVLVLILLVRKSTAADISAMLVIFLTTLTVHPAGVLAFGLVVAALVLERRFAAVDQSVSRVPKNTIRFAVILAMIAGFFWLFNGAVLLELSGPFASLVSTLSSLGITRTSVYTPNYFSGPSIYALAWSLPVAASGAYLVASVVRRIRHGAVNSGRGRLLEFVVLFGLLAIAAAFLSVVSNPAASVERYADSIGYFLLLLPAAALVSSIVVRGKVAEAAAVIAILFVCLSVGASSPDWAPIEATQFGAVHFTYAGYQEAYTLAVTSPYNCFVYPANDVPLLPPDYILHHNCIGPTTEQITRNVLAGIQSGIRPTSVAPSKPTLFVLTTSETDQVALANMTLDVAYSSNYHLIGIEQVG